jgi:hypothetical protein
MSILLNLLMIHAPVLILVKTGPASYWSTSLRVLEHLMSMWQNQDTKWCQWAIISKAHILYYACS